MKIYHNTSCSKSCETLELIQQQGVVPEIVEYMNDRISAEELKDLLSKLQIRAIDLIRKNETLFLEKYQHEDLSEEEWIAIMVRYPELIERPIVVDGDRVILGRPPRNVMKLF